MPAAGNRLMTVDEFRELPRPVGPYDYELHDGILVQVTRPKPKHLLLQRRLRKLLEGRAPEGSLVEIEMPFRAKPEGDLRVADVGYLRLDRFAAMDLDVDFEGAPDLVIEVISPSNRSVELVAKEQLCLETGAREFWVVDPTRRQVRVTTAQGEFRVYKPGDSIPLAIFGSGELAVDAIFA